MYIKNVAGLYGTPYSLMRAWILEPNSIYKPLRCFFSNLLCVFEILVRSSEFWVLISLIWMPMSSTLKLLSKLNALSHIYQEFLNWQLLLFETKIWKSMYFWIIRILSKVRKVWILLSFSKWLWNYSLNVQRVYLTLVSWFMWQVGVLILCSCVFLNGGCIHSPWIFRLWQQEKFRVN